MDVRFLSGNEKKTKEVQAILSPYGINAIAVDRKIKELQTEDVDALVRDKAIRAYQMIGRPLFVEHTGLYASALGGFPGGLTQVFWDTLEADRVADIFKKIGDQTVVAKTHIGFIDGRNIRTFDGEICGRFSDTPQGHRDFQWDSVFIPDGYSQTFAQMDKDEKNRISMRKLALDNFARGLAADV